MINYKILSVLLMYPEHDFLEALDELRALAAHDKKNYARLTPLLTFLSSNDLITLQENYVQTFDRTPSHSLHLFEHLYGEDRQRGQALIDLIAEYHEQNVLPVESELPDYLPLFLEFLSICSEELAQSLLNESIHVIAHIGRHLQKNASPYAAVFDVLEALATVKAQPLTVPPINTMDEALETFGPNFEGIEPLLNDAMKHTLAAQKRQNVIPVRIEE